MWYVSLGTLSQAVLILVILSFVCFFMFFSCYFLSSQKSPSLMMASLLAMVMNMVTYRQLIFLWNSPAEIEIWLSREAYITLLGINVLFVAIMLRSYYYWNVMDNRSVKEGMDYLDDGLLYYYEDGQIKLVNRKMIEIIRSTGTGGVWNGNDIAGNLIKEKEIRLDGKCYRIERNEILFEQEKLYELIAADITEIEALRSELTSRNEELRQQGAQLADLSHTITETSIADEILKARISIHDEFSSLIFLAQKYLEDPSRNEMEVRKSWEKISIMYGKKTFSENHSGYNAMFQAAKDLGIRLNISGNLPRKAEWRRMVLYTMREFMANTIKHAHGDEIRLSIREENGHVQMRLNHNGEPPQKPVQERGGLRNLRSFIESNGGEMELIYEPEYTMVVRF